MTTLNRGRACAFTLIELLIVVAIIAILAAIAVPNFLEAQTRAKISRVKSDMRSLATAIEMYRVDQNQYPITSQWINGPGAPTPSTFNNRMRGITTPIAYISSLPLDIFWEQNYSFPVSPGQNPSFEYTDYTTGVVGENFAMDGLPHYNLFETREAMTLYYGESIEVEWVLQSAGPDLFNDFQQIGPSPTFSFPLSEVEAAQAGPDRTYDPTNGTVSTGDIARTNARQRN